MAQQWFYTRDGKTQYGPIQNAQLRQLAASGQLLPTDYVRTDTMNQWVKATQVSGLFTPPAPPPLPAAAAIPPLPAPPPLEPIPEVTLATPVAAPIAEPAPASKLGGLGSSWLQAAKGAVAKVQEKSATIAQTVAAKAQTAVAHAAEAAKAAKSAATSPPAGAPPTAAAVSPPPIPPLVTRHIAPATSLGIVVPDELAKCWNDLDQAGVNPATLLFFGATASRHEGSMTDKVMGFFSSNKQAPPICHLAVTPEAVHVVHVGPEGKPVAKEYAFNKLSWTFATASDAGSSLGAVASFFKKPTAEEVAEKERTVALTLQVGDESRTLNVYQSPARTQLSSLLGKRLVDLAEAEIAAQRHESAETLLARVPADNEQRGAADALTARIGRLARAQATLVGGHPEWPAPARGLLRYDALGLTFQFGDDPTVGRIEPASLRKVFPPRPGRFPQEYLDHIQSQRRSAQRSIKLAQLAMRNKNDLLRMNARTSIANAKAKLRSIKVGPPFVNRVTIVARVAGSPAKITFDFAGKERDASEQETHAFVAALESASSQWGKSAPAEEAAPASAPPRKKIVGCPGCKAKLRATKPGIIRCPRCSAKVRVQESQFAS